MSRDPKGLWKEDERYSEFDERGIPTHENKKEKDKVVSRPLNDKLRKKLEKEWAEQEKQYNKWLEMEAAKHQ